MTHFTGDLAGKPADEALAFLLHAYFGDRFLEEPEAYLSDAREIIGELEAVGLTLAQRPNIQPQSPRRRR